MNSRTIRVSALLPCAALILGAAALQAAPVASAKFHIPFAFEVRERTTMPAGDYRLQQDPNSNLAFLVNASTGQSVMILRSTPPSPDEGARLVFETRGSTHELKKIS